jgi:hypothetical protein
MIAEEGRRPIGGPSPFWSGSPPNLVSTRLVFHFLPFPVTSTFPPVSSSFMVAGPWQAQVSPSSQQAARRGCSPGRAAEEGHREEEEESAPCLRA